MKKQQRKDIKLPDHLLSKEFSPENSDNAIADVNEAIYVEMDGINRQQDKIDYKNSLKRKRCDSPLIKCDFHKKQNDESVIDSMREQIRVLEQNQNRNFTDNRTNNKVLFLIFTVTFCLYTMTLLNMEIFHRQLLSKYDNLYANLLSLSVKYEMLRCYVIDDLNSVVQFTDVNITSVSKP